MAAMGFWIAAALLVAVTLVALIAPLVRRRRVAAQPRTEYDVAVFRDQLKEVERDLDRGLLDDSQAEAARTEIKRRLLAAAGEDVEEAAHQPGGAVSSNLVMVVVLALLVPAGALGLYRYVGAPHLPDMPLAGRTDPAMTAAKERAEIDRLVGKLKKTLEERPGDVRGWRLLAQTYQSLEKYGEGAQALNQVVLLTNRSSEALSAYAEALTMANKFSVTPTARAVFAEALQKDPDESRAAYYLGLYEAQNDNIKEAHAIWTALAQRSEPDAPWMEILNEQITRAARKLGVAPPAGASTPATAQPGPSAADVKAAEEMSGEDRNAMIRSMVQRLADKLAANPDDREGWLRLARAYEVLGETEKAAEAHAKAAALSAK